MKFLHTKAEVHNRGEAPDSFLEELVIWGRQASSDLFVANANYDIYDKVSQELGPFVSPMHRRAIMLEVMRVLAGFESSWKWHEGVDTSRSGGTSDENAEAGAWQVSYDSRHLDESLADTLKDFQISSGGKFRAVTVNVHPFAMLYVVRLLRIDIRNPERIHNGPIYKGGERHIIRASLRDAENSIYPWLNRQAVDEFLSLLSNS